MFNLMTALKHPIFAKRTQTFHPRFNAQLLDYKHITKTTSLKLIRQTNPNPAQIFPSHAAFISSFP
jgi:hypothetical protein